MHTEGVCLLDGCSAPEPTSPHGPSRPINSDFPRTTSPAPSLGWLPARPRALLPRPRHRTAPCRGRRARCRRRLPGWHAAGTSSPPPRDRQAWPRRRRVPPRRAHTQAAPILAAQGAAKREPRPWRPSLLLLAGQKDIKAQGPNPSSVDGSSWRVSTGSTRSMPCAIRRLRTSTEHRGTYSSLSGSPGTRIR